jgi:hypothetical protein
MVCGRKETIMPPPIELMDLADLRLITDRLPADYKLYIRGRDEFNVWEDQEVNLVGVTDDQKVIFLHKPSTV